MIYLLIFFLGEMIKRKPLFAGKNYIDQLKRYCMLCGKPSISSLSEFVKKDRAVHFISSLPISTTSNILPNVGKYLIKERLGEFAIPTNTQQEQNEENEITRKKKKSGGGGGEYDLTDDELLCLDVLKNSLEISPVQRARFLLNFCNFCDFC